MILWGFLSCCARSCLDFDLCIWLLITIRRSLLDRLFRRIHTNFTIVNSWTLSLILRIWHFISNSTSSHLNLFLNIIWLKFLQINLIFISLAITHIELRWKSKRKVRIFMTICTSICWFTWLVPICYRYCMILTIWWIFFWCFTCLIFLLSSYFTLLVRTISFLFNTTIFLDAILSWHFNNFPWLLNHLLNTTHRSIEFFDIIFHINQKIVTSSRHAFIVQSTTSPNIRLGHYCYFCY